ncbi:MAG TPA: hypothetical protein PLJ40_01205 [Paludibacteraceae bacterium]|nr:hypothetical protein [Paludibacteraceae bacterium]
MVKIVTVTMPIIQAQHGILEKWQAKEEAQPFTWSLEGATLTQIHQGEMGQKVPKVYTLKTLNDSTLSYRDDYGVSFTFIKVK